MAPTRFICERTLARMGIVDDVRAMLIRMGLGTLTSKTYPLYPELVRQFLASVELRFKDIAIHTASEGTLSYLCRGVLYEISIPDLCDIYGFDRTMERCRFPDFPEASRLWSLIGTAQFVSSNSRDAKLSLIRNPVIRILAKILGHSFSGKSETGSLTVSELILIDFGLPDAVRAIYHEESPPTLDTNLGAIFAAMLVLKKTRGLKTGGKKKIEYIGSLLTPLFQYHGISVEGTECVDRIDYYTERFFKNTQIMEGDLKYHFYDREGNSRKCKLPLPMFTSPTSRENLEFLVDPQYLLPDTAPTPTKRRVGTSRARAARETGGDYRDTSPPDQPAYHAHDTSENVLPESPSEYDLLPLHDSASDGDRMTWLIDAQKKQHTMLQKMWRAIVRLSCPEPPSCFRATTRETRGEAGNTGAGPSVAGHGTSDREGPTGDGRLPRRRRAPGGSRSASSEDH